MALGDILQKAGKSALGQAFGSFATNTPLSQIQERSSQREQGELEKNLVNRLVDLSSKDENFDASQSRELQRLAIINPEKAQQLLAGTGNLKKSRMQSRAFAAQDVLRAIKSGQSEKAFDLLQSRAETIQASDPNADLSETVGVAQRLRQAMDTGDAALMTEIVGDLQNEVQFGIDRGLIKASDAAEPFTLKPGEKRFRGTGEVIAEVEAGEGAGKPAGQQEFEALISGFTPEEQAQSRRIAAGLDPRAIGSGAITTATTEGLTEQVATSEETIKQRTKFAEMTGASRAKTIDKSFESVEKINANIRNLDKAISAIDAGASTGAIVSRFTPTLRKSTVALEQVQAALGLDVVGSVSFGALSEGELNLALATALPTKLPAKELKQWIIDRQTAQGKLRDYYSEQIDFLDQGGTVAGFLRGRGRQGESGGGETGGSPQEGATATNPQTGQKVIFRNGQWQSI